MHRARLADGREVACKLQYPDMPSVVEADLRQVRLALSLYHRVDNALQNEEIYKELSERLREELDYVREAAQMRLYGLMLKDVCRGDGAGAGDGSDDRAAADDDVAAWARVAERGRYRSAAGGAQSRSRSPCSPRGTRRCIGSA